MEIKTINGKNYKVSNAGFFYSEKTNDKVINVLDNAYLNKKRVKLFYGDIETGKNWNEENDTFGTIGKSTGIVQIPLLIKTTRSYGGGAILTDCIIGIKEGKNILYKADNFKTDLYTIENSDLKDYAKNTLINGELYGRHKTESSAKRLINKLQF